MPMDHEVSSTIRFRTDGRGNNGTIKHGGDSAAVFGKLLSGPAFRVGLTVNFLAALTLPDGSSLWADAVLDYPADPELVAERECFVLLYNLALEDVPPGTTITSAES